MDRYIPGMIILGIETSCDETAASLVEDGQRVLSNVVASQVHLHAGYGGVVPELAAREHLRGITPVVTAAMSEAGCTFSEVAAVSVTSGPGLVPALLVGGSYGKGLAASLGCPFLGINHFLAHIYGAFFGRADVLESSSSFPLLALVVSGGHTSLVVIRKGGTADIVGTTLDDAAGEAFDKAAKILELGYPGGPIIDRLAKTGDSAAYDFPRGLTGGGGRPLKEENRFNFSFSGVKTALLYAVKDRELSDRELADAVASYQQAVVDVLVTKTRWAAEAFGAATVCVCGGVACNSQLRAEMQKAAGDLGWNLLLAEPRYCTDNAAMVAGLAYHYLRRGIESELDLGVSARLGRSLGTVPFTPGK
jgi:N6-L-threonylcarbamoyladenine synthase